MQNTPPQGWPPYRPIEAIRPGAAMCSIKVIVLSREPVREISGRDGVKFKVFGFTVADANRTEVYCNGYRQFVDVYDPIIKPGACLWMHKFEANTPNRQFKRTTFNYEFRCDGRTEIQVAGPDPQLTELTRPQFKYKLSDVINRPVNSSMDLCLMLQDPSEPQKGVSKAGRAFVRRDLRMCDDSGISARITLWGQDAETFQGKSGQLVCIRGAQRSEFGGQPQISLPKGVTVDIEPALDGEAQARAEALRAWYSQHMSDSFQQLGGQMSSSRQMQSRAGLGPIRTQRIGMDESDQRQYLTISGYIDSPQLQFKPFYVGCPHCKKKLTDGSCVEHGNVSPAYYWNMRMTIVDFSGDGEVSFFGDTGTQLTGVQAERIKEMYDQVSETADFMADAPPDSVITLFGNMRFKRVVIRVSVGHRNPTSDRVRVIQQIQAFQVHEFNPVIEAGAVKSDIERLKKKAAERSLTA